ncbi:uncharacterized protein LOC117818852 isoform X2 [Notolabrus celidotus]|uniref:uncharacterized protein LOC117818852 isoform X2 n=1 Tax=Notolabrus celidotus TaxID=1203425 RepID=UPI00148F742A|nr:uncharacterized protein LOC117818852 isoform X2 [Notolabrus celidotus]
MDLRPPEKAKRDPDYLNSKKQPPPTDLMSSERMKRVERNIEKAIARQLSSEQNPNPDDRKKCDDQTKEPTHNMVTPSPATRTERSRTGSILEAESSTSETSSKVENTPSSRKPLILRVPQSESFSSLSDIMKRLHLHESSPGRNKRGPKTAVSEMSRSMMDLSVTNTDSNHDEKGVPVPRFKASCFDPGHTPASSLMKNRSEDVKPLLYRTPKNFIPKGRPRSSSYALNIDWRRSLAEMSSEQE